MKKRDYHIHGEYSSDASIEFEQLINRAIKEEYDQIAFTEHFDYLPSEAIEYGLPAYYDYARKIDSLKIEYKGKIEILLGAEIGECHRVTEYISYMDKYRRPDIVIGSIHVLSSGFNVSIPFSGELSTDQVTDYYEQNLAMVEISTIDILGHLGIHKRYYKQIPDEQYANPLIEKILQTLIKKNIALEVNYSPFRKPYQRFLAEIEVIKKYLALGGELVSIGSDSHILSDFDDNYEKTVSILKQTGCKCLAHYTKNGWSTFAI